jgi:hypothetical protein
MVAAHLPGRETPVRASFGSLIAGNFDLIVIFVLMVSDIRIFKGSAVASFTLLELFCWGYCAPYVVSCLVLRSKSLPAQSNHFVFVVFLYGAWLIVLSFLALLLRSDSDVIQNTKNILPGVILVPYLLIRIRDVGQVVLLSNLYIFYAILASLLGLLQLKFGGPYVRELVEGIEYKQDLMGDVVTDPIVGFSAHPNEFAMAVLPAVSLAAIKAWDGFRRHGRIDVAAILVACLVTTVMVLSQAKGAVVFTAVGIAFVASPLGRNRSFLLKLAWMSVFIVGVVAFGKAESESGSAPGASTVETRLMLWQTALRGTADDWYIAAFGDGHGYLSKWSDALAGWEFPNSHNTWLDQVVQFGIPALLIYTAIWWVFFRTVEAPVPSRPALNATLIDGCRATIMAMMGYYFFEPVSNDVSTFAQLLLLMVLAMRTANAGEVAAPQATAGAINLRGLGPLSNRRPLLRG